MLKIDTNTLQNFNESIHLEWLETNGLGGWAGSSVIGCNTRRYHGLLIAATRPPAERFSLLSKLDETIIVNEVRYEMNCNQYDNNTIHPRGFQYLQSFTKDLFPEWIYEVNGIRVKKTVTMVHGENTTLIIYKVLKADKLFDLELLPLISARHYHSLQHSSNNIWWDVQFGNSIFRNQPDENAPPIFISVPGSSWQHQPCWFNNFNYAVEIYRGQDFEEDLFNHGRFIVRLKDGDSLGIIISTEDPSGKDAHELLSKESFRREALLRKQPNDEMVRQLVLAADQFIVRRDEVSSSTSTGTNKPGQRPGMESGGQAFKTIIAGYHWFTDWGRDTMISLPGLCLSTGRFEDAKKILLAFANSVDMGMLPNRFLDNGEAPEYNNVDGTLWFFIAVYKYMQATNDKTFVLNEILPVLKDIIGWHQRGTRYHIHETEDCLLYSGEEGVQLTWMDARVGDWVVTARTGKAVEVNALWYNALCIYAELLQLNNNSKEAAEMLDRAGFTKANFNDQFWNKDENFLYDVIDNNFKDDTFRPNQLFAISLPFPLIEGEKANNILKAVTEKLYTPVGLRSLPRDHPAYVGIYGGDAVRRDSSYHQGTVWSWLLGAYVDALIRTQGSRGKPHAMKVIADFRYHLNEGCIGSVSEIFDADVPHHPRGCVAQAWGVAEMLRVVKDYGLYDVMQEKARAKSISAE